MKECQMLMPVVLITSKPFIIIIGPMSTLLPLSSL